MSLMTLDPSQLRPLTIPEKKCISDMISHYLVGEEAESNSYGKISFNERSFSRLASFSQQNPFENEDIFATVDLIAKTINWYNIRHNHKRRLRSTQQPNFQTETISNDSSNMNDQSESMNIKSDVNNRQLPGGELEYLPPDTPALRSLLQLRDVELVYLTSQVAKTVVKQSIWNTHMSDR